MPIDSTSVESKLKELNLDLDQSAGAVYKSWNPRSPASANHILFVAEDIYANFLRPDFNLPGHESNGTVIFRLTPLDETIFCSDLREYWAIWVRSLRIALKFGQKQVEGIDKCLQNDCAITMDPENKTLCLLETLPGCKARTLPRSFQNEAVNKYFQSMVLMQKHTRANESKLKDLLGPQYDDSFQHFVHYIPPSDLQVRAEDLIGQGSFGRVYKGRCKNLPSDTADFEDLREGDVAVKIAFDASTRRSVAVTKFFQEVSRLHLFIID